MTYIEKAKGDGAMYKRTLKTLAAAVVLGVAVPTGAYAMPTDHTGGAVVAVSPSSRPIVSEKIGGLNLRPQTSPIMSEKIGGLNVTRPSSQPVIVASSDNGFQWNEFGIGAGVMLGALLVAGTAAVAVRHYHHGHGHLAH